MNANIGGHDRLLSDIERHGDYTPLFDAFDGSYGDGIGASDGTLGTSSPCHQTQSCALSRDVASGCVTAIYDTADNIRATQRNLFPAKALLRAQRLDDLLAGIRAWQCASGPERSYARRNARHDIREWRRLYEAPERAAFLAAVERSRA